MRTEDGYIIYKCLNDDTEAFGLLVDKYKASIYALAYSKLKNFHDAEDVAQDTFIRAYEKLYELRRWDSFASWLYRIAVSLCKRRIRSHSRRPDREFIEDREPGFIENHTMDFHREELLFKSIHESLESLPENHRQVLTLHYLGGMTSFEIARFSGVSAAAIRKRLSKARSLLEVEMLATMNTAFGEQKLSASFTLRIVEKTKYIKVKPLPKPTEFPLGTAISAAVVAVILSMGAITGLHNITKLESARLVSNNELPVDILKETPIMSEEDISWEKKIGKEYPDSGASVQQTADGGYIVVGSTRSFSDGASLDIYLAKVAPTGNIQWEKPIGGDGNDNGNSIHQTDDGGYIITGQTEGFGLDSYDAFLIKVDSSGNTVWPDSPRFYGGGSQDEGSSVQQTTDGGYIIAGTTYSFGAGNGDVYLIKTDGLGYEQWSEVYGGTDYDAGLGVQQTLDSGYIIAGQTRSFGAGAGDIYLIKTDANGNMIWERTFGGSGKDTWGKVQQTTDGGYIVVGCTESSGAGSRDAWLIKTDANGIAEWNKTYGGAGWDEGYDVRQLADGGYIVAASKSESKVANIIDDAWLIKTDEFGDVVWDQTFGGEAADTLSSVEPTSDGGYIAVGRANSSVSGMSDVYLVKTDDKGAIADLR